MVNKNCEIEKTVEEIKEILSIASLVNFWNISTELQKGSLSVFLIKIFDVEILSVEIDLNNVYNSNKFCIYVESYVFKQKYDLKSCYLAKNKEILFEYLTNLLNLLVNIDEE